MSLLEDASLLSFYFILQSSQKIPSREGIEDHQTIISHPKKHTGSALGSKFTPGNSNYGAKRADTPKLQNKYI